MKIKGGFRKNKSTIASATELTDDIGQGLNENMYTVACFVDLRKAFDTVNHDVLISKLHEFGYHNNTVLWLQDYLNNRHQICIANSKQSKPRHMICGVPQGSILGPLLFLIYVNNLDFDLYKTKVKLYADDTVIYSTNKEEEAAQNEVKHDLKLLMKWCNNNQLTINIKKTKLMVFGTKGMLKKAQYHEMYLGNDKLQYVNDYVYLGIKLDNKFTFELHANECCKHVVHKNYVLSKIRRYISAEQALCIYKSMILPYFCYGDVFMHNLSAKTYDRMQKLQNKSLRICLQRQNRCNVRRLHKDSNINYLEERRDVNLLNFMYKRRDSNVLLRRGYRALRRYDADIFIEHQSNNNSFESSVAFKGVTKWNRLPVVERRILTHESFKSRQKVKLRNLLLAICDIKYDYSIVEK